MKCEIQWIGLDGKPTPDNNEAVAIANAHEIIWSHPEGNINNRIVGYSDKIRGSFPICADHLPQLIRLINNPERGKTGRGWSISPLPGKDSPEEAK